MPPPTRVRSLSAVAAALVPMLALGGSSTNGIGLDADRSDDHVSASTLEAQFVDIVTEVRTVFTDQISGAEVVGLNEFRISFKDEAPPEIMSELDQLGDTVEIALGTGFSEPEQDAAVAEVFAAATTWLPESHVSVVPDANAPRMWLYIDSAHITPPAGAPDKDDAGFSEAIAESGSSAGRGSLREREI